MYQGMIEAQVSAGCLLFMHTACSAQRKSDAADCILYTQLAATKKHPRFTATSAWNDTWLAGFTRFGWALKTHEAFACSAAQLGPGSIWAWLKKTQPAFIPTDLLFAAESNAWQSLLSYPDQPAIELLATEAVEPVAIGMPRHTHNGQKMVLQLGFLDANGELSMALISFTHGPWLKQDFLFEPLLATDIVGNVELRFYSLRLMDLVYAPLRSKISQALEDRRSMLVCALKEAGDVH
jgi:hypothetical protein